MAATKSSNDQMKLLTESLSTDLCEDNESETTDVAESGRSDTEESVLLSGSESMHSTIASISGKRCRFGSTPLETVPPTPIGAAMRSPPGLSRAAMRVARDQCKSMPNQGGDVGLQAIASKRECRFGDSQLGTVPKTPVGARSWKALKAKFGSPPGLSRAAMRQERDECKGKSVATSWGSSDNAAKAMSTVLMVGAAGDQMTPTALRSAKKKAARDALMRRTREEAALLKSSSWSAGAGAKEEIGNRSVSTDAEHAASERQSAKLKEEDSTCLHESNLSDQATDVGQGSSGSSSEGESSSSSEWSSTDLKQCRFMSASLRTVPMAAAAASPPGLSRASLRRARDACKMEALVKSSWGHHAQQLSKLEDSSMLTIGPNGKAPTQSITPAAPLLSRSFVQAR